MGLREDLEMLRQDLIHELDVINLYQRQVDTAEDPRVKALISHIRDEEKEHVAECTELIKQLDLTQAEEWKEIHPRLIAMGQAQRILEVKEEADIETSPTPEPGWTVGSLINMSE